MKKKIFTLLLTLAIAVCQRQKPYTKTTKTEQHDTVIYKMTKLLNYMLYRMTGPKENTIQLSNYLLSTHRLNVQATATQEEEQQVKVQFKHCIILIIHIIYTCKYIIIRIPSFV